VVRVGGSEIADAQIQRGTAEARMWFANRARRWCETSAHRLLSGWAERAPARRRHAAVADLRTPALEPGRPLDARGGGCLGVVARSRGRNRHRGDRRAQCGGRLPAGDTLLCFAAALVQVSVIEVWKLFTARSARKQGGSGRGARGRNPSEHRNA